MLSVGFGVETEININKLLIIQLVVSENSLNRKQIFLLFLFKEISQE
jgi:hypothetical protein